MSATPKSGPGGPSNRAIGGVLSCMVASVLLFLVWPLDILGQASGAVFCLLCLTGLRTASIREFALLFMAGALAFMLWYRGETEVLWAALDLAAFFAAFIVLITLMREAAALSGSILSVGRFLTSQPPGKRYYATALGGHFLGIFLNFGAVSLMAPLIQKSVIRTDGTPDENLERRQISALMRGFSWILLWAPTTLAQGVLLTLFPDVHWLDLAIPGLATSAVMIALGRILDRLEWSQRAPATTAAYPLSLPAAAVVLAVCTLLIVGTFLLRDLTGFSVAQSLMFIAPLATLTWFMAQCSRAGHDSGGSTACMTRVVGILIEAAPKLTRSAMALGLSGFIGRAAAEVLPFAEIAHRFDIGSMPGWVFLSILPMLVVLGGQIALSPILVVVLLGEVMKAIPVLPADPTMIVFALSAGWALSMSASPNATATLLISATTGIAPTTLTWRWNLRYALICYTAFVILFRIFA